jgi:superfamily I DNA/RNA helicase
MNEQKDSSLENMWTWTFFREVNIPEDASELLLKDEKAVAAFATFRDVALFTTKRLIIKDVQGLTGKKIEIYSLPYSSILAWSSENAGMLDINSEIEIWTLAGKIKINLKRDINIRKFDKLIAACLLRDK